ncbi:unnamed protein product [Phaedon cochleariae]|uniref:Regulatory protein zeste n=1 Tax=Phaedon cochleariae TaxID=80249 RepID=A0A9P0DWI9_PHACE|nr:unnamed protein product [Phaedon cochleariae]
MDKETSLYCSQQQKNELVQLLQSQQYAVLLTGKFTGNFTFKEAQEKWKEIASILNSIPGCNKDWKHWRKTWQDIRSKTKKRQVDQTKYTRGIGGGPSTKCPLNENEKKIVSLINPTEITGNMNILETDITFSFEDIQQEVDIPDIDVSELVDENAALVQIPICNQGNDIPKSDHQYCEAKEQKITEKTPRSIPIQKQRFKESLIASRQLTSLAKEKLHYKKEYYDKKIILMERQIIALEKLVECFKK